MSNTQEVAYINGYAVKDKVAREKVDKTRDLIYKPQLADFIDCDVFAQVIGESVGFNMSGFGAQSFAIGNDLVCVGLAGSTDERSTQVKLIVYNLNTGSVVAYRDNLPLGHCNGMTYCTKDGYFYAACGGGKNGLNKIEVFDSQLNNIKTIDFTTYKYPKVYGIAWHDKTESFYTCMSNGSKTVFGKYDYNFTEIDRYPMVADPDVDKTNQTVFVTDDYLFYITNNLANERGYYNKLTAYHIDTMDFYKKVYVMHKLELEGCSLYNGNLYMLFNSQNSGLICKGSLFNDNYTGNFIPKYFYGGSMMPTTDGVDHYYMDSTYMGFFVDNTEEKPFNKLLVGIGCAIRSTGKDRLFLHLKGDFSNKTINIKHLPCNLTIEGYGDTKPKIGGVFLQSIGVATLRNFETVKRSEPEDKLMALRNIAYAWLDGIDFNGTGAEQDALWLISSSGEMQNCNFNSTVTRNLIHCVINSHIAIKDTNNFNVVGRIYVPEDIMLPSAVAYERSIRDFDRVTKIPKTTDFNITKIKRSGRYTLASDSTSINCPDALKKGGYTFTVEKVNGVIRYEVVKYDGFKFKATYVEDTDKLKWYGDFYTTKEFTMNSTNCSTTSLGMHIATTDLKINQIFGVFKTATSIKSGDEIAMLESNDYFPGRDRDDRFIGVSTTGKSYLLTIRNNVVKAYCDIPSGETVYVNGVCMSPDILFYPNTPATTTD